MNKRLAVDSTQTVRTITQHELNDPGQGKWFVVQLAISPQAINLDFIPRLDAVASGRLYSVSGQQQGEQRHALRLGFFRDERAAMSVRDEVSAFFGAATVVRVGVAEHERFANRTDSPQTQTKPASSVAKPVQSVPTRDEASRAATVTSLVTARAPASASAGPQRAASKLPSQGRASSRTSKQGTTKRPKTLAEELLEEARQVVMAQTGRHQAKEPPKSWVSRWLGRSNS